MIDGSGAVARPLVPPAGNGRTDQDQAIRAAAQALEATFISEMLKGTGLGEARDAFGGGIGEDQFASFLREEQSKLIADRGGFGLAESIFQSLKEHT